MTTAEFLIMVFTCIGAFVTGLAAIEQGIIKKLLSKGATSSQKAIELQKLIRISRLRLHRLKRLGAIKEVKSGKYYFDESAYRNLLKNRVIIVIPIIIILALIITIIHIT